MGYNFVTDIIGLSSLV